MFFPTPATIIIINLFKSRSGIREKHLFTRFETTIFYLILFWVWVFEAKANKKTRLPLLIKAGFYLKRKIVQTLTSTADKKKLHWPTGALTNRAHFFLHVRRYLSNNVFKIYSPGFIGIIFRRVAENQREVCHNWLIF